MKTGVIYARYSSASQNEQSIAGQVEVCTKWAEANDIDIVHIYHDEALSGKTDKRPDFQKMIKAAKSRKFDYIIVYKLDRFARNRYDSAIYKAQLKKYGVRILSAMENIADGPEGIILESVLEGMAEYYSANLAQNVLRGLHQRAELGKHLGGKPPLGYKLTADRSYEIDDDTAPIVRKIFEMYAEGHTLRGIANCLNDKGYTTSQGRKFTTNSFYSILKNEKYIGIYKCMDVEIKNAIPPIVSEDIFEKVQQKVKMNKIAPAHNKGDADFHLTGKVFCGKCGHNMIGDSGTSRNGTTHYYYTCLERKKRRGCKKKKSVKKDWIEQLVVDVTTNQVLTDENIKLIAKKAFEISEKERADQSELISLNSLLKETQTVINNLMKAIEQGIITETTKSRLLEAEERKKALLVEIAKEEIKKPKITAEQIEFFLHDIKNKVYNARDKIEMIIRTFVNAVYLYDDKIVITYNFKEGEDLKQIELEDIDRFGFDGSSCTIFVLSEPLLFGIIVGLRDR